ncbi:MAG: hypothetical protein J7M16_02005, partial [Anaerolineae bacterium]|nr:hypothetical protein [Anaerolineae bacterium]
MGNRITHLLADWCACFATHRPQSQVIAKLEAINLIVQILQPVVFYQHLFNSACIILTEVFETRDWRYFPP